MYIKVNKPNTKKASGLDKAEVAVSAETDGRIAQVTAFVKIVDCYDCGHIIGSVRMSPAEARALANRLNAQAADAELLLANEQTVKSV